MCNSQRQLYLSKKSIDHFHKELSVMTDEKQTLQQLKDTAAEFVRERDWNQFHSPKNLSMDIAIEAAELMEKFLWLDTQESRDELEKNRQEIEEEFADTLFALLCFANEAKIDMTRAFQHKISLVGQKYPVDEVKGRREKYTHYMNQKKQQ